MGRRSERLSKQGIRAGDLTGEGDVIQVVSRALKAVNYEHRGGPTHVNFKGTVLLPKTAGEAKIEVMNGYTQVEATFKHVEAPTQFGTEFLTYVLWAITPDGHSINLGELIPDAAGRGKMLSLIHI